MTINYYFERNGCAYCLRCGERTHIAAEGIGAEALFAFRAYPTGVPAAGILTPITTSHDWASVLRLPGLIIQKDGDKETILPYVTFWARALSKRVQPGKMHDMERYWKRLAAPLAKPDEKVTTAWLDSWGYPFASFDISNW